MEIFCGFLCFVIKYLLWCKLQKQFHIYCKLAVFSEYVHFSPHLLVFNCRKLQGIDKTEQSRLIFFQEDCRLRIENGAGQGYEGKYNSVSLPRNFICGRSRPEFRPSSRCPICRVADAWGPGGRRATLRRGQ